MTTNYDPIAEQYKRAKRQPWRAYVEAFTLLKLVGAPTAKKVIDIACGEGFYTRMIRTRGAAKVTGVDLSQEMIGLARASEAQQPLGIDYIIGDGLNLKVAGDYDLAVAAYLLNYAHDRTELNEMCRGIARSLKPGGRFVAVNSNPACDFSAAPSYRKYGFETSVVGPFREGAPITWTFYLEDGAFSIENYFLNIETHEQALHAAGFRDVRWHRPQLSPEGESVDGSEYWADLLGHPPLIFIECFLAA
ncbi:MAG TPA: methyltransferase domain-containing protein [Acetobacteraceae bacterium]|nr:methyltransferase domain-containing protein [Acetobacteraceae bacterium]